MKYSLIRCIFVLLTVNYLIIFSFGCKQESNASDTKSNSIHKTSSGQTEESAKEPSEVKFDRYWNDLARYLAGQEPLPGSALDSIEFRPEAVQHRAFFKQQVEKEVGDRLKRLETWAEKEVGEERKQNQNILYPFSGADFLHISTIYPNGKTYTLYGLEPEGNIPDIRGLHPSRLPANLQNVQSILSKNFNLSFFRTSDMGREFTATELSGTTPILMLFMAMKGYEVLDVNRILINRKSEVVYLKTDGIPKQAAKDSSITGVEIKFRKGENGSVQTLRYLCFDAQDIFLKNQTYFLKYLSAVKPAYAYFKSASYLMHWNTYKMIRDNILDASDMIVQDDTGIAFRFYDKSLWKIQLYGKYIPPIQEFTSQYQRDLAAAYTAPDVKPLDFGLGYHNDLGTSNLQIARRIKR